MGTNNIKILWLVIALLAILNLTTISVIVYHNIQEWNVSNESILFEPDSPPLNGAYFRNQFGFNNSQMEAYRTTHRRFRHSANTIIAEINERKRAMFDELQRTEPDRGKLDELADSIGILHAELKKETVNFYLTLSEVCDEVQKQKLKEIFVPLFKDTPVQNNGQDRGYGRGRGANNRNN